MNERLLEPLKYYETEGKAKHEENVKSFLDGLIAKSGVNADENRATVKKYYAEKIQNAVLLPVAFTISIPLCLLGRFDEVYNASYYFTGILLLTAAVYLVLRIIILLKKGKCYL